MPSPRPRPDSIWQVRVLFSVRTRAGAGCMGDPQEGEGGTFFVNSRKLLEWNSESRNGLVDSGFQDPGSKGSRTACGWEPPWPASNGGIRGPRSCSNNSMI